MHVNDKHNISTNQSTVFFTLLSRGYAIPTLHKALMLGDNLFTKANG